MEHSRTTYRGNSHTKLFWPILIAVPMLLAIMWGPYLSAEVYTFLRFARGIAEGVGMALDIVGEFPAPVLDSPLFAFLVSVPARMGVEPTWAALLLSAAGWIVAAFALLAIGQSINRPGGALVAALLLSFNPTIITTLGSAASWIVAFGWLTIALLLRRRFVSAVFAFLLFLALHIPWPLIGYWSHLGFYRIAVVWSVLLFAAATGADLLAEKLLNRDLVRLTNVQIKTVLLVAVFLLFGFWQGMRLWQLFQERSEMLWQLEEEIASWLRTETDVKATLLTSERIGYLAERSTATMPEIHQLETATAVQTLLQSQPVDYLVTTNDLHWQQLRELVWFRLAFEPVEQFYSSYLHQAPFTIWAYRQPVSGLGQRHTINARVPDRLWIIGYQIGPQQVQASESVEMVLYIEAPEATLEPSTPFQAIVRLISPIDYSTIREWIVDLPQSVTPEDWQSNEVIVEQFPLEMPDELEAGAYLMNLSLLGPESENLWPFSFENDINQLDRIPIGGLIIPSEASFENIQELGAIFADQIELVGFSSTEVEPGVLLEVGLQWQAQGPIEGDYVVFVHVLNSNGELVANHDSRPDNGRFPTPTWLPGIVIPDTHSILLPRDLPAGEYQIKVGLYQSETGERLPATGADGDIPTDNAILLAMITIP